MYINRLILKINKFSFRLFYINRLTISLMSDQSNFNDDFLNEKFKILLDEDKEIKKWNEGILIKSLILLPIIVFIIGLFIVNRPENLKDVLFLLLYPVALISIGLLILFGMTSHLK